MLTIKRKGLPWLLLMIVSFTIVYSFIGIQKHTHFQTFGWDTAVFDQQFYLLSQFKAPYSSLVKMNGLGDHFQLIPLLLGGLFYRVYSHANMLFILQSLVACLSAWPLYLITVFLLKKTKLTGLAGKTIGLSICFSYLFSVPFQSMLTDEFHNEPFIAAPLLLMIYFLLKNNNLWYWINYVLILMTKEIFGLLGIPLGIYVWLKKKNVKKAVLTALVGLLTFYLLLFQVMPSLAGTESYLHFGGHNNPQYLVNKFVSGPSRLITELIDHPEKRKTITASLFSFGFLPLLAPTELIAPLFSLAMRFYDDTTPRLYAFNNHYAAPLMPLLSVALSFGVFNLLKIIKRKRIIKYWWVLSLYLIIISLIQSYIFHGPINSLLKPQFYQTASWEKDANELISKVPKEAVIATQNSLLPHLSQRDNFYLLPEVGEAEFIVVDLADGPNKFSPLDQQKTRILVNNLIENEQYQIAWQKNDSWLLKKTVKVEVEKGQ
ncbi:DUF2079 domain-containing protein [Patescibacteria group bacterium]